MRALSVRSSGLLLALTLSLSAYVLPAQALEPTPTEIGPPSVTPTPEEPALAPFSVAITKRAAKLGEVVALRGTAGEAHRTITLQGQDSANRWRTITANVSATDGTFEFPAPVWLNKHRLRVVAAKTATAPRTVSPTVSFHRYYGKPTRGKKNSWGYFHTRKQRWNPCKPMSYTITKTKKPMPAWMEKEVHKTMDEVYELTGLRFQYAGKVKKSTKLYWDTIAKPKRDRTMNFTWSDEKKTEIFNMGEVLGVAPSHTDKKAITTAAVVLNRKLVKAYGRDSYKWVVRHEVGHALGLRHVDKPKQLMTYYMDSDTIDLTRLYARGDLAGLTAIGASHGCATKVQKKIAPPIF